MKTSWWVRFSALLVFVVLAVLVLLPTVIKFDESGKPMGSLPNSDFFRLCDVDLDSYRSALEKFSHAPLYVQHELGVLLAESLSSVDSW